MHFGSGSNAHDLAHLVHTVIHQYTRAHVKTTFRLLSDKKAPGLMKAGGYSFNAVVFMRPTLEPPGILIDDHLIVNLLGHISLLWV